MSGPRLVVALPIAAVGVVVAVGALAAGTVILGVVGGLLAGLGGGIAVGGLFGGGGRATDDDAVPAGVGTANDLNDFELRAKVKGDFAVARLADRLEKIGPRLADALAGGGRDAADVGDKLRRIHDVSLATIRDAFDLHLAAREMATEAARRELLDQRETLVGEASDAVDALDRGIDRLRAAAARSQTSDRTGELSELGGDLDRQLEVARRVEQRMRDLEARAKGDLSHHERFVTS